MSRLSRITQLIFGSTATTNQLKVFGSLAASAPANATNIGTGAGGVQNLSNYLAGWYAAVLGSASPTIQDMNSLFWMLTTQIAYGFQLGIPEWDSATTYYVGSLAQDGSGNIYRSIANTNLNNALTDTVHWACLGIAQGSATVPGIAFTADPETGIHQPSTGSMNFSISGTDQASLTPTGLALETGLNTPQATIGPSGAPAFKMKQFTGTNIAANTTVLIASANYTNFFGAIGTTTTSNASGTALALIGTGSASSSASNTIGNVIRAGSSDGGIVVVNTDTAVANAYNVTLFYS